MQSRFWNTEVINRPFETRTFLTISRYFLSGFQTTIQKPDHLTTRQVCTIWIPDLTRNQMVTVPLNKNLRHPKSIYHSGILMWRPKHWRKHPNAALSCFLKPNTVGIWISSIWIAQTSEEQNFICSVIKKVPYSDAGICIADRYSNGGLNTGTLTKWWSEYALPWY